MAKSKTAEAKTVRLVAPTGTRVTVPDGELAEKLRKAGYKGVPGRPAQQSSQS